MQVKVQKKDSIIVKVMRFGLIRKVHTPRENILVVHNVNGPKNFYLTLKDNAVYNEALGEGRRKAYFRCVCNGDPAQTLPEIVCEVPADELPKSMQY